MVCGGRSPRRSRSRRSGRGIGGRDADALLAANGLLHAHGAGGTGGGRRRPRADAGDGARAIPALPARPQVRRRATRRQRSPAHAPSPAADWRVAEAGGGTFTLSPVSAGGRVLAAGPGGAGALGDPATAGDAAHLRFVRLDGCAVYPEAQLDATGTPAKADVSYGRVGGLLEGHMHWMTYDYLGGRFHCGRPWHPYGIPTRCRTARRSRAWRRRGAVPELPQLRQSRPAP